jgi:hypothetical protein
MAPMAVPCCAVAVVALAVVLHRELPVAGLDDVHLLHDLRVAEVVGSKVEAELGRHGVEVGGRLVGEADEEEALETAQVDGLQIVAVRGEALAHVLGEQEIAVEPVGPLMVAADQVANRGLGLVDEAGAAVATDIVVGADRHRVVAHDHDRGPADVDHHAVAGLGHVGLDADMDPVPPEDDLEVALEDLLARVERRFQAVAGLAAADQRRQGHGNRIRYRQRSWRAGPRLADSLFLGGKARPRAGPSAAGYGRRRANALRCSRKNVQIEEGQPNRRVPARAGVSRRPVCPRVRASDGVSPCAALKWREK